MEITMKALKTLIALVMSAALALSFVSCGEKTPNTDEDNTSTEGYNHSAGLDENGFFEGVKASDIVTLPDYKGIEIPESAVVASEEAVQAEIDALLENYDTYEEIVDRAVESGDTVNIDYVGYLDGVQIDGANTGKLGRNVVIGETEYAEGYIDVNQLMGHMPGETVTIDVTYPADYDEEELAGKVGNFEVTINFIQGALIKATLTEEIAKYSGQDSIEDLISDIEDWVVSSQRFYVFKDLIDKATCSEIPQSVIDYLVDYEIYMHETNAYIYGYSAENYLKTVLGVESMDEYIEGRMESLKAEAVRYLAAQAIAEIEGLKVTSEDIDAGGYRQYIEEYGEPYLKQFMLFQEIIPTFIVDNGVVANESAE